LRIKFFKLPHPYNAIIDNVLGVHFFSGHSVNNMGMPIKGKIKVHLDNMHSAVQHDCDNVNMLHGHVAAMPH